ncbi:MULTISPECIES: hypothetical protein [Mycolicibacterium]|uniref:Transposase n=1 Tax=Mycolicibacterium nivoides TaxID=2487344 RepID=A0ABW9LJS1_9MYCO|nr:hypothetical protein [Mycolicibacterium fortuitum]UBV13107.1 hypothetical protein H8Z57_19805 [Mycolicibacterium fortuitum]
MHGHYCVDDMRGDTRAFDIGWFHVAIQGAVLFINDALTLHHRRRTHVGAMTGVSPASNPSLT